MRELFDVFRKHVKALLEASGECVGVVETPSIEDIRDGEVDQCWIAKVGIGLFEPLFTNVVHNATKWLCDPVELCA